MKAAFIVGIVVLSLPPIARAEMQKLSEVGWWASYGGINDEGTFTCAMVTATPDGRGGKFVIEHHRGEDVLLLRFLKPTWAIPKGDKKNVALRFGYGPVWQINGVGSATELRGHIPLNKADPFLAGFQSAGRIDVTFVGGTETPWELATGGGGFVEPDFRKCIRMSIPVQPTAPTQP